MTQSLVIIVVTIMYHTVITVSLSCCLTARRSVTVLLTTPTLSALRAGPGSGQGSPRPPGQAPVVTEVTQYIVTLRSTCGDGEVGRWLGF